MTTSQERALEEYKRTGIIPAQYINDERGRSKYNPAYEAVNQYITSSQKSAQAAQAIADSGIELRSISLDRTSADILSGKRNIPLSQLNPEQRYSVQTVKLKRQVQSGEITPEEYQTRLNDLDATLQGETSARTIEFARRAKPSLIAAAKAEEERFKKLGEINFTEQEKRQTQQIQKVADNILSAGYDPSKLIQAQGRPNPNAELKINTPTEIKQRDFAKEQAFRPVASVLPDHGIIVKDKKGNTLATNVKQSGGFTIMETKPSEPVNITGVSEGSIFSIMNKKEPEMQGPIQGIKYPEYVKTAFYSFTDEIGPKKPDEFTGLVGKDFFAKDKFVTRVDALGVPRVGNYGLEDITLENFGKGFYEGGILPITQAILAPKPIFSDIFGRTEAENRGLKKTVEKIEKFAPAGPVASGEIIGQLITGKPIIGTGKGLGYDVGSVSFDIASIFIPSKKGLPLRVDAITVPVEETSKTLGYRFTLGYGKLSKPILTTIGDSVRLGRGESIYQNLGKTAFKEINPTGRGFEFLTLNKTNADVLASDTALDILQKAGKITPLGRKFIVLEKEAVGLIKDIKLKPTQKSPLLTSEGLVSDALEAGEETRVFVDKILPRLFGFKGSQAQRIQVRQKFIAGTGREGLSDFDIDYGNAIFGTFRAKRATARAENLLSGVAGTNRRFVSTGTKLFSVTLDEGGFVYVGNRALKFDKLTRKEKQRIAQQFDNKVFELLTEKDATRPSGSPSSQDLSQVGGFKLPKDQLKIKSPTGETIKVKGLRFQILTKIASSATLQGPLVEKFKGSVVPFLKTEVITKEDLEKSFRVGPFIPRYKDVVDQPFLFKELGTQGIESGKYAIKGQRLVNIGEEIKTLFPEIDFGKPTSELIIRGENSLISKIGSDVSFFGDLPKNFLQSQIIIPKSYQQEIYKKPVKTSIQHATSVSSVVNKNNAISLSRLIDSSNFGLDSIQRTNYSLGSSPNRSLINKSSFNKSLVNSPNKAPSMFIKSPSMSSVNSPSPSPSPSPNNYTGFPPSRSPPRVPSINPIKITDVTFPKPFSFKSIELKIKFDQFKSQRLPSYSKRKFFVASPADPLRAGVFAPKGVKELRSSSSKIFKQIDINLRKARRNKKAFDPLSGFKIAKSGKYVYVSNYPLKI